MPIHIAIAEDNAKHLQLLQQFIQTKSDYVVDITANNGKQLIQYLHHCKELPHVAIVDYQMNPVDGLQLAYYIHLYFPTVSIMAISGHIHNYALDNMFAYGCKGYKSKYFLSLNSDHLKHLLKSAVQELLGAIEKLANNEFYLDSYFTLQNLYNFENNKITQLSQQYVTKNEHLKHQLHITKKQYQVLYLHTIGFTATEIAPLLFISNNTVNNYLTDLKQKLQVSSQKDLITQCYRYNLIPCASYEFYQQYNGGGKNK